MATRYIPVLITVYAIVLFTTVSLSILAAVGPSVTRSEQYGLEQCHIDIRTIGRPFITDKYCVQGGKPVQDDFGTVPPRAQHIFYATIPIKRTHRVMYRWNQYILASMSLVLNHKYLQRIHEIDQTTIAYEVAIGYRSNSSIHWTKLASSNASRILNCAANEWDIMICDHIPLFELWSTHYEHYIINLRFIWLPMVDRYRDNSVINDISLFEIHQHPAFTERWFLLKSVFFPISLYFIHYSKQYQSSLYKKSLLTLNTCLAIYNVPIEWLSLWFNMPWLTLFNDIRLGVLILAMMIFWAILITQYDVIDGNLGVANVLKPLVLAFITAIGFTVYEFCERGIQVFMPFYSLWGSNYGRVFAYCCVGVAGVSGLLYFVLLGIKLVQVRINIKKKLQETTNRDKTISLTALYHYLLLTIFVTILSILGYVLPAEIYLLHSLHGNTNLSLYGAILFGNYGLWNSYIAALTVLSSIPIAGYKILSKISDQ